MSSRNLSRPQRSSSLLPWILVVVLSSVLFIEAMNVGELLQSIGAGAAFIITLGLAIWQIVEKAREHEAWDTSHHPLAMQMMHIKSGDEMQPYDWPRHRRLSVSLGKQHTIGLVLIAKRDRTISKVRIELVPNNKLPSIPFLDGRIPELTLRNILVFAARLCPWSLPRGHGVINPSCPIEIQGISQAGMVPDNKPGNNKVSAWGYCTITDEQPLAFRKIGNATWEVDILPSIVLRPKDGHWLLVTFKAKVTWAGVLRFLDVGGNEYGISEWERLRITKE